MVLLRYCGGKDGHLLLQTERYVRARGQSAALGASFWEQISYEPRGAVAIPFFRHAVLKLAMSGGHTVYATDVKRMFSKEALEQGKTADKLLADLREAMTAAGIHESSAANMMQVMGVTEVAMAAKVLQMQLKGEKKYSSLQAIAHDAALLLGIPSAWSAHAEETASGAAASSSAMDTMRELLPDGSVQEPTQILHEAGYLVGGLVRRKADRTEFIQSTCSEEERSAPAAAGYSAGCQSSNPELLG